MASRARAPPEPAPGPRGRCRCGHLTTHHLVVAPVPDGTGFHLVPTGSCQICGAAGCPRFVPAVPSGPAQP